MKFQAFEFSSCFSDGWILIVEVASRRTTWVLPVGSVTKPTPCMIHWWPVRTPHHFTVPPSYWEM